MSLSRWLLFVVTETMLCVTPGPAVLFVLSQGLAGGVAASLRATLGILGGNTFYFVLSALGLGAVLAASHDVFTALKYAGTAYLIVLGVKTMLGAGLAIGGVGDAQPDAARWRALGRGFALQIANPKAVVFFAAFLPQFVEPGPGAALQVALLGVTSVVIEFVVLAGYGALAGSLARLIAQPLFVRATNIGCGALLIAAAIGLALVGPSH